MKRNLNKVKKEKKNIWIFMNERNMKQKQSKKKNKKMKKRKKIVK